MQNLCHLKLAFLNLLFSACAVLAQENEMVNPAAYEIGMDYTANQADFIPYFEGEPPYGIEASIGGDGGITSNINFNNSMLPGTTRARIAFKFLPDPDVLLVPEVRVRFHYWPETLWVESFQTTALGYATDVTFRLAVNDDGEEYVQVVEDRQGMELMQASPMRITSGPLKPREWNEVEIDLTTTFDFPERAWTSGVQLEANEETRKAVEEEFRRQHAAFAGGRSEIYDYYRDKSEKDGPSYGMTGPEWFDRSSLSLVGTEGYELLPYDSSKSELRIYGYGRLATLHPSPVLIKIEGEGIGTPFMYFWKDAQGNWHPRD